MCIVTHLRGNALKTESREEGAGVGPVRRSARRAGAPAAVMGNRISIVIPMLNEAAGIVATLQAVQPLRVLGHEVIVVDGGSSDDSCELARPLADQLLQTAAGRGHQMNAGAHAASGNVLLFLHADTTLPPGAPELIDQAFSAGNRVWGRFNVHLSGVHPLLRLIERLMNWRSCATGIATGDQAMFMTRLAFEQAGRFPDIPLMEDIALSQSLKQLTRPACVRAYAVTSSRRWEGYGIIRTVLLQWLLRLGYFLGVDPALLAQRHRRSDPA